ncbi:coiled-coil domain-containing protein 149 [Bacillus rossius redtenbacheri]|uniref:coiled-coil domain-containing protein 149 n=1 Tax=Bacillus rossius redtenbacheri TaxID=93214 RepID=UPI002FDD1F8C
MKTSNNKTCVEDYVDNFLAENSALRRKLQSKAEALLILSKELDRCRTERDQFKLMAEQLQDRCAALKRISQDMGADTRVWPAEGCQGRNLAQVLGETKELNKALRMEVEDLRQKLRDAQGDMKVLRLRGSHGRSACGPGDDHSFPAHQREELVQQLETINLKCSQMEADLQAVLDEKEELVTERDGYKCKAHRLNHQLHTLLRGDSTRALDVDALVMENRYLQERLQQTEEEKELAAQALTKYKSMLEKKRSKGAVKLGTSSSAGLVMSHKQVQQLLERGTATQLPNTAATLCHMKSLCLGLLEALSDKTLALAHQKKANKILAGRISELEQRLQGCHVGVFPSQLLLEGYASSEVDRDTSKLLDAASDTDSESSALANKEKAAISSETNDVPGEPALQKLLAVTNHAPVTNNDADSLPSELQELVQKALLNLQEEMQLSSSR